MDLKQIKSEFETSHPQLIEMGAEIEIAELEYEEHTEIQITVRHPFIFDNRLVPDNYQSYKVNNLTLSHTIPVTLNPVVDLPLWHVENPNNYILFVQNNIEEIRRVLNKESITTYDALDAITGGFTKHLDYWNATLRNHLSQC